MNKCSILDSTSVMDELYIIVNKWTNVNSSLYNRTCTFNAHWQCNLQITHLLSYLGEKGYHYSLQPHTSTFSEHFIKFPTHYMFRHYYAVQTGYSIILHTHTATDRGDKYNPAWKVRNYTTNEPYQQYVEETTSFRLRSLAVSYKRVLFQDKYEKQSCIRWFTPHCHQWHQKPLWNGRNTYEHLTLY